MRKSNTMKIALCGVIGALCITILMMGFLFPFATYACPAVAACCFLPVIYEYRQKTAFTLYVAVSFLGLMLVPEQELIFMFIFVFGLYTVIKFSIDRIKNKVGRFMVKLVFINLALTVSYGILLFVFPVAALVNEFSDYGIAFTALLIAMFNLVFFLYDKMVERVLLIYIYRLRPKIFRR